LSRIFVIKWFSLWENNNELRKERKMPDHAFVPFLIRCCGMPE
jgi:hypothetical protein